MEVFLLLLFGGLFALLVLEVYWFGFGFYFI